MMRAKYPYKGQRKDELTFAKGDIIIVKVLDPKNKWHSGYVDGQDKTIKKFPANYVRNM